jgi:hypothetical protein
MRLLRTFLLSGGAASWLLALAATVLLLLSRSEPWLMGKQHEPHWSWAVGSGRIKLWVAQPEAFESHDWWPAMYYRGLDGSPIRWDVTLNRQEGLTVMALPLWLVALAGAIAGTSMIWFGAVDRRRSAPCAQADSGRPQ